MLSGQRIFPVAALLMLVLVAMVIVNVVSTVSSQGEKILSIGTRSRST